MIQFPWDYRTVLINYFDWHFVGNSSCHFVFLVQSSESVPRQNDRGGQERLFQKSVDSDSVYSVNCLDILIIVIERQIIFAKHNDLGFDKEQLLRLDLPFTFSDKDISKANVLSIN